MAFLARAYADKIKALEQEDFVLTGPSGKGHHRSRNGKGKLRTEAKDALLPLVFPHPRPGDRSVFSQRLQRAARWYEAAAELGWGILCLMPDS